VKSSDAHALNDQQLVESLRDARQEAFNLRFRHATGELENTARIPGTKRDVARLLTIARQRGIDVDRELSKFDDEKKK
jgi:large subunit ribosomal protein L29